jgi:hypothetical protein
MSKNQTSESPQTLAEEKDLVGIVSHDLLACPFCGQMPEHRPRIQGPPEHGAGAYWPEHVHCRACNILFRRGENNVVDPVARWNKRFDPANVASDLSRPSVDATSTQDATGRD